MNAATQIAYQPFDADFFKLPKDAQTRIQEDLDDMGSRLDSFPHYRMKGSERFRLRVGDYRIIYRYTVDPAEIHLLAVGHRREIYR